MKYRFDCQNIRIAVVGSQPRVGVTTAAISLCHWLQCVGAMACYVEDNESRVLPIFARSYCMDQDGYSWRFEGVQYRRWEPDTPVNFIVRDMGNAAPPLGTYLLALICGTKAW